MTDTTAKEAAAFILAVEDNDGPTVEQILGRVSEEEFGVNRMLFQLARTSAELAKLIGPDNWRDGFTLAILDPATDGDG